MTLQCVINDHLCNRAQSIGTNICKTRKRAIRGNGHQEANNGHQMKTLNHLHGAASEAIGQAARNTGEAIRHGQCRSKIEVSLAGSPAQQICGRVLAGLAVPMAGRMQSSGKDAQNQCQAPQGSKTINWMHCPMVNR